eukprot:359219-Chlamydomonas_euryale.AAC.3
MRINTGCATSDAPRTKHTGCVDGPRTKHTGCVDGQRTNHIGCVDGQRTNHIGCVDGQRTKEPHAFQAVDPHACTHSFPVSFAVAACPAPTTKLPLSLPHRLLWT